MRTEERRHKRVNNLSVAACLVEGPGCLTPELVAFLTHLYHLSAGGEDAAAWLFREHRISTFIPQHFNKIAETQAAFCPSHLPLQQSQPSCHACTWRQRESKWEMVTYFQPHKTAMPRDEDSKTGPMTINHQTDGPYGV